MFGQYQIRTSQVVISTAASSEEAAIEIVMASESCPRSAILSIKRIEQPLRM